MAHGVNAAMKEPEPTTLQPAPECSSTHAQGRQLPSRHHPVLALCQRTDSRVDPTSSKFDTYLVLNFEVVAHGPIFGART